MYRDLGSANVLPIITALVIGYFFLDPPWRWLVLIPAAVVDSIDIILWLRWRKRRSITGHEAFVGTKARVVSVQGDELTVRAKGQLWKASSLQVVHEQDEVVIEEVDGLRLVVAPARPDA